MLGVVLPVLCQTGTFLFIPSPTHPPRERTFTTPTTTDRLQSIATPAAIVPPTTACIWLFHANKTPPIPPNTTLRSHTHIPYNERISYSRSVNEPPTTTSKQRIIGVNHPPAAPQMKNRTHFLLSSKCETASLIVSKTPFFMRLLKAVCASRL